jgi:hypothetical protein
LDEKCPRWKLHKQCIKYLGPVSFIAPLIRTQQPFRKKLLTLQRLQPTNKKCCHGTIQKEREAYEVIVRDGKLMYKLSRQIVDTAGRDKGIKWIFVLSTCKNLYIGQASFCSLHSSHTILVNIHSIPETDAILKFLTCLQKQKGVFQHSSFLAGGATSAAGRLVAEDGILKVRKQIVYSTTITTTTKPFSPKQVGVG